MCNYSSHGECHIESGTKLFYNEKGTSQLRRHIRCHSTPACDGMVHRSSQDEKRSIAKAAEAASTFDTLALSFCYQKKVFAAIAYALIHIRQLLPANVRIDVKDLVPSVNKVLQRSLIMASKVRVEMQNERMKEIIRYGGGISCTGVKVEETWCKYYELFQL